jgi:hypothetical protein
MLDPEDRPRLDDAREAFELPAPSNALLREPLYPPL